MAGDVSDRSRAVALALVAVLGVVGGHRFYVGKIGTGVLMLLTGGGLGIWWLIDFINVAAGNFRDAEGRRVVRWEPSAPEGGAGAARRLDLVLDELEMLRGEMGELHERVDFLERLLARIREQGAIPPPG